MRDEYEPRQYWERTLAEQPDERGAAHPQLPRSFNRVLYKSVRASTDGLLRAHGLRPSSVLDVGFGTGIWLDYWRARGVPRVAGVDITDVAVERARDRYPGGELARVDIASEPVPFAPFELVSAMNVLLHIVDAAGFTGALRAIRDALVDGGWLLALEPVAVRDVRLETGSTAGIRTLAEWRASLDAADFELVDLRAATCLLGNPVDASTQRRLDALLRTWFVVGRLAGGSEARGAGVAGALYPLDRVCVRLARAGPSGKLLLARARAT